MFFRTCVNMLLVAWWRCTPAVCDHIEHGLRLLSYRKIFGLQRTCHQRGLEVFVRGFVVTYVFSCLPSAFPYGFKPMCSHLLDIVFESFLFSYKKTASTLKVLPKIITRTCVATCRVRIRYYGSSNRGR